MALADLEHKRSRVASPRSGADDTGGETDATRRSRRTKRRVKTPHSPPQQAADTSLEQRLEEAPRSAPRSRAASVEHHLEPPQELPIRRSPISKAEKKRSLDEMSDATYRPDRSADIPEPELEAVAEVMSDPEPVVAPEEADSEASSKRDSRRESNSTVKRESTSTVTAEPPLPTAKSPVPVAPPRNPGRAPPVSSSGLAAASLAQEPTATSAEPALSRRTSTRSKRLSRMTAGTTSGGESDTDFVSAYSSSPIDKALMSDEDAEMDGMSSPVPGGWEGDEVDEDLVEPRHIRQRVSSTATEVPDARRYTSFNAVGSQ
jgi:hypothetical protein